MTIKLPQWSIHADRNYAAREEDKKTAADQTWQDGKRIFGEIFPKTHQHRIHGINGRPWGRAPRSWLSCPS
jgi:hypothetical protein